MLSETSFLSSGWATALTVTHVSLLGLFAWTRWCRAYGEKGPIQLAIKGLINYDQPASKRAFEFSPDRQYHPQTKALDLELGMKWIWWKALWWTCWQMWWNSVSPVISSASSVLEPCTINSTHGMLIRLSICSGKPTTPSILGKSSLLPHPRNGHSRITDLKDYPAQSHTDHSFYLLCFFPTGLLWWRWLKAVGTYTLPMEFPHPFS